ncbi:hypothetical protein GCM10007096_01170 [Pullulanibacillus pueri]|uniref:Uncharacterized protein n=1 Tax=Pullulanibacillus pueri TaxID=1437324 RepID=A0A8J3EJW0_9BACL|nr:hypothetical protein GCM10007096_01170 [Pullulanibacillus pueri]
MFGETNSLIISKNEKVASIIDILSTALLVLTHIIFFKHRELTLSFRGHNISF